MAMKPEITRYDINKLLMVVPKQLGDSKVLTSAELLKNRADTLKWRALFIFVAIIWAFFRAEPKPLSSLSWAINACLLLSFIFYVYWIWGRPALMPTFSLELDKNKIYPGDEVSVNIIPAGDLSLIQEFTVSLVLQEHQHAEIRYHARTSIDNVHYAYREILHQSTKIDICDVPLIIPKHLSPSLMINSSQMVNNPNSKEAKMGFKLLHQPTDIRLEWGILIECKVKSYPLLKRHYIFTVLPLEESQNDSKNNLEYF